jgi:hypothetical protein
MIDLSFRHTASLILLYIQDILNFKDTLAYKFLLNLTGDDCVQALESIGTEAAPHRFSIYATSYSLVPDKQQQQQELMMAYQNKLVSFSELQLLKAIDEPRVAAKQSAYFQEKAQKRIEQQTLQAQQAAMAMQQQKDKALFDLEKMKVDGGIEKQRIQTNGFIYQADKMYAAKIETSDKTAENDKSKEETKLTNEKQLLQDKATIDLQKSLLQDQ